MKRSTKLLTLFQGVGVPGPAVFVLVGGDWFADTSTDAVADGYAVSDGGDGYVIDDAAGSGEALFVLAGRAYLEIAA